MTPRRRRRSAPFACLIVGEDSYLRSHHRDEIIASSVPEEARAFGVARFSLAQTRLADVLTQANLRPMLSPQQVLVVTEVERMGEEDVASLEAYREAPAEFTRLVFEAEKLDRRTRAARLLREVCEVYEADSPKDTAAAARAVVDFARAIGLTISSQTLQELVFVLGPDQGRLRRELEKLRAYAGEKETITSADLAALVSPARRFKVFDLADLLAERRRGEALLLLRQLLEAGESPVGIVGLLAWLYRQLLEAQALPPGTPVWKARQTLRAPPSKLEALVRQARRFPRQRLQAALPVLRDADVHLKSGAPNPTAALEALVVELTRGEEERARA